MWRGEAEGVLWLTSNVAALRLCSSCNADTEGLATWLASELQAAVEQSDEFEKLPEGGYRRKQTCANVE
jgi:hypothetical protein